MLADLYRLDGNVTKAMDAYRTAIVVEPNMTGPRGNLAGMLEEQSRQLQQQLSPQAAATMAARQREELASRVEVLMSEADRLRKHEHELLKRDLGRAEGLVQSHLLHYRYAMSCYLQRDMKSTEIHLLEAHRQQPEATDYLLGLATYYVQVGDSQTAAKYVQKLLEVDPDHPGARSLAVQLSRTMENNEAGNNE